MDKNLNSKILTATKWSAITEILAKLIVPVSNMILARILAPEVFGIIATVNMIISFCDMFAQAGFQKYLVQHPYRTKDDLHRGASVAFWTNFSLSVFLWICLIIFRFPIAAFVGNKGYESAIAIAGMSLPITALSSIQIAMQQRNLDYKTLFYNRLFAILTPLVVTIPLALLGFSYWSLIIGTIVGYSVQATVLTIRSEWKPRFFYSFTLLREMLSFSMWTLFENLTHWFNNWIDIFIISNSLGAHFTGLYKNSQTTVTGIITIVTSSVISVLFSSLSRVQDDNDQFESIFLNFQKGAAMLLLPLGAGMLLYNTLVTKVLLGSAWLEAAPFIGIWGLSRALCETYGAFCREAYRAKGKPRSSLFVQLLHLVFIVPVCLWGVKQGFSRFIYIRSFALLQIIPVYLLFMKFDIKFRISKIFTATFPCILSTLVMVAASLLLKQLSSAFWFEWLSIFICIIVYFSSLLLFPSYRSVVFENIKKVKAKILK